MKCPRCNGSGWDDENMIKCLHCHGSGEVEATNEEWLNTLSTEKKAEFLVKIVMTAMHPVKRGGVDMEKAIEEVTEWLKKPHKDGNEKTQA